MAISNRRRGHVTSDERGENWTPRVKYPFPAKQGRWVGCLEAATCGPWLRRRGFTCPPGAYCRGHQVCRCPWRPLPGAKLEQCSASCVVAEARRSVPPAHSHLRIVSVLATALFLCLTSCWDCHDRGAKTSGRLTLWHLQQEVAAIAGGDITLAVSRLKEVSSSQVYNLQVPCSWSRHWQHTQPTPLSAGMPCS